MTSRLSCCERGAKFVGLWYATRDHPFYRDTHSDRASFLTYANSTPPTWALCARPYTPHGRDASSDEVAPVDFCPFCGVKVPGVRLRARPPARVCVVLDGGYYCDTCDRRLMGCRCATPERLWEAAR